MSDHLVTLKQALDQVDAHLDKTRSEVNSPTTNAMIDAVETLRQVVWRLVEIADVEDSCL